MARMYQRYSDELLAEHLAAGKTVAVAARAAGISERTAYRRKKQPAVRDRIDEVRRAALETASARLDHGMVSACDTLTGQLGHTNPHVQIRAAQTVIQLALKVRQEVEVAGRLDPIVEPTRPSPVVSDAGASPAVHNPDRDRTDRSDYPWRPEPPTPDGAAGPPTGPAPAPAGIELAAGGEDRGPGAGLHSPPTPTHPDETSGLDRRHRPGRAARLVAVVGVLLLLAGLPHVFAGETRARVEHGPAADGGLRTCQTLTEPATVGDGSRSRPPEGCERPAAGSNSSTRVPAPTATATSCCVRLEGGGRECAPARRARAGGTGQRSAQLRLHDQIPARGYAARRTGS